uniref:Uncharacterized protein n=1 Tax=Aegilops tauschii TaxID=37682 RepID=M8D7W7_AEGTA
MGQRRSWSSQDLHGPEREDAVVVGLGSQRSWSFQGLQDEEEEVVLEARWQRSWSSEGLHSCVVVVAVVGLQRSRSPSVR